MIKEIVLSLLCLMITAANGSSTIDYLIKIRTGRIIFAGTDSNIFLRIYGDKGITREINIDRYISSGNPFEIGDLDVFTIPDMSDVGALQRVEIRSDRSGFSSNWYLKTIEIKRGIATFNRWINGGDSVFEEIVMPTTQNEPSGSPSVSMDDWWGDDVTSDSENESIPPTSLNSLLPILTSSALEEVDENNRKEKIYSVDYTIWELGAEALIAALSGIGDGSGLTFSSHEQKISNFKNITTLDEERFGNLGKYFTSAFKSGYHEAISDVDDVPMRTKISWTQLSCVCVDVLCINSTAIDIKGVYEVDNGDVRGFTPLKFLDDNEEDLPCLSHSKMPPISELKIQGCNWKDKEKRHVHQCDESKGIDGLQFVDNENGRIYARSLRKDEIIPSISRVDPDITLSEALEGFEVPESNVEFITRISIPGTSLSFPLELKQDIAPLLNTAKDQLIKSVFDELAKAFRPEDFTLENPGSNATLAEFVRVSDWFSISRLIASIKGLGSIVKTTVSASPLYMQLKGSRPETSPTPEILSGILQLAIECCALGVVIGSIWRIGGFRLFSMHSAIAITTICVVITETIAYIMRWISELDQNFFQESMILVRVTGADRFDGILPLGAGKDGKYFIVTTYLIEITDESSNLVPVFSLGIIGAIWVFGLSVFLARDNAFEI